MKKNLFHKNNMHKALSILFMFLLSLMQGNSVYAQWVQTNSPYGSTITSLAVSGTNLFAGIKFEGVFFSTNNGESWTAVNMGLTNTDVRCLAVSGSNLFAGTAVGGVFRSIDNGESWTAANTGLTKTYILSLVVSGTNLFTSTYHDGVFRSTNNGESWTAASMGLPPQPVGSLAVSGTNLFAGFNSEGVFLSTNNGESWTAVNTGLADKRVKSLAVSGTNLFAGTSGDYGVDNVFLSTNNGESWTAVNTGLSHYPVVSLVFSGTNLFAGTAGSGVFLSTNNGESWTAVNTGLTNYNVLSFAVSGTNLFAGTAGGGVFRLPFSDTITGVEQSTGNLQVTIIPQGAIDAGAQWRRIGTETWLNSGIIENGIPVGHYSVEFKDVPGWGQPSNVDVTINPGGTSVANGTYSIIVTVREDMKSGIPTIVSLEQNYPNPFNPTTTIAYKIPGNRAVPLRLKIYDTRGALVRTLVDGAHNPGSYSVIWNATDDAGRRLSSGIYFSRLEAGTFTRTRKMLLVR